MNDIYQYVISLDHINNTVSSSPLPFNIRWEKGSRRKNGTLERMRIVDVSLMGNEYSHGLSNKFDQNFHILKNSSLIFFFPRCIFLWNLVDEQE